MRTLTVAAILALAVAGCSSSPEAAKSTPAGGAAVGQPIRAGQLATDTTAAGTVAPPSRFAASRPGASAGVFMTVGCVVAEANGEPIYADRVLSKLDPVLAAKVKQMDARSFRLEAEKQIRKEVEVEIGEELHYAAAQRRLKPEERQLADMLTVDWRRRQITEAGGSLAVAKARAAQPESGAMDFEETVRRQYRSFVIGIYRERYILPFIVVTADDMRRFYDTYKDKLFGDQGAIRIRVIKVDFTANGGRKAAAQKASDLVARLRKGDDFNTVAGEDNDDKRLKERQGLVDMWLTKGGYVVDEVDAAAWKLRVGEYTTEPVEAPKAFFLVKLDEAKAGNMKPFEDPEVQKVCHSRLRESQYNTIRDQELRRLSSSAVRKLDERMLDLVVEMAMQKYVGAQEKQAARAE